MNIIRIIKNLILLSILWISNSYADVVINVTAEMMTPACDIRSNNNSAPLNISFGSQNIDVVNKSTVFREFPLYLSNCDFRKNMAIVLTPNTGKSIDYNGKPVLETSISNLGINFNDITGGTVKSLEVGQSKRITPEKVNDTEYRIDLQADLVSIIPPEKLAPGKFTASMTVQIVYD
ncbi:MAG: fimbrial protein [Morganella sp. (in: enterobacteria)]